MKVINPVAVGTAQLTSSTAPEPGAGETTWLAATTYAVGDIRIRVETHRKYRRLTAGTSATAPELDATNWLNIGPTNRYAMFDNAVGTSTQIASPLTTVTKPGFIGGLALLELKGASVAITLKSGAGGTTIYSRTVSLDGTIVDSLYDWFFTEYVQMTDVVLTDLPDSYGDPELTVSITGSTVACGVHKTGRVQTIGVTEYDSSIGIIDYSIKKKDDFGNTTIVERSFSKRGSFKVFTEKSRFNNIFRALSALRAVPAIYIATEELGYEPMIIYGFYKDFSIDVAYPTIHYCNLEIEGLI